jgi:AraC family transcriptional activator of tynA and feaB
VIVREVQSADEWEQLVSECFVPLNCVSLEAGFHGRMDHLRLGHGISVSTVASDGVKVERSDRQVAKAKSDDLHLSFQRASHGRIIQAGRAVNVGPRSVSVYSTTQPYTQDYSAPGQKQLILQVPREATRLPTGMVDAACERLAIPMGEPTRVLLSYASFLHARGLDGPLDDVDEVTEITADLAAVMLHSSYSAVRIIPHSHTGLLRSIEEFAVRNAWRISVDDLAQEFFISRRHLYNLFASEGTTPGDYLRRARLKRAASMLQNPLSANLAIAQIGTACGYDDATTFTRAFRREFQMNPSDWRHASRLTLLVDVV